MKKVFCLVFGFFALILVIYAQEAFQIFPSGNVGIGVESANEKLEVAGNIKASGRIMDATGFVMPVGTIMPYAFSIEPEGWLICDGSVIDKSINPELTEIVDGLRAAAGDNADHPYIAGLAETQARLPDLRGDFIRGVSTMQNAAGTDGLTPPTAPRSNADPDAANRINPQTGTVIGAEVGSWQDDAFQMHQHSGSVTIITSIASSAANPYTALHRINGVSTGSFGVGISGPNSGRITTETRSDNTYVLYIIKY
ncbi:MAG: tail fiber protein [Spirochaetales bacterium]|nr:tail fiber protein [Spirochaetales bacterium]